MARADGPALRRAAGHLGALAVTGALLWRLRATGWAVPLLVAHGYVLAFVFCAFHETAHRTAFRTRWLNTALGTLAGLLTFWPYRNYRVYHWEHHRFTQDEARDPELYFAKPASVGAYLLVLTGVPNLVRRVSDLVRLAGGRADRPWMAALGASAADPGSARLPGRLSRGRRGLRAELARRSLLLLWIAPLLVGQAFLPPVSPGRAHRVRTTRDCLENTRTTRTLALVRLFAWNMPYHAEHHAYPAVPFHALPRLHGQVRGPAGRPRARLRRGHRQGEPLPVRASARPRRVAGRAPR